ncbi:DUF6597 domain-containing transcriptional factor [Paenibacillus terreus]|uniref:DUF6597 domain-containing transcriptional factor n=1 Tax=Paenibacillus terreus TaxID=1387834 RepID=A0ABV5B9M4_9BACL
MRHSYRPVPSPKLQPELHHPGYSYREYAPSHHLAPYIVCYWTMEFQPGAEKQLHRIIPDGCVGIIVDLLSSSCRKAAFVDGLATQSEVLHFSAARSMFGIQFYSEAAGAILKSPLSALTGHHVFLEDIWGIEGPLMVEEILAANNVSAIIKIVERKLSQILDLNDMPASSLVYKSMQYMYGFKGNLSVKNLAEKLNFSERHLRRAFDRELGLSPKEMLGIVRFQSMLQDLYRRSYSSLTDLALKYGYYDQSHFAKDFTRYYGLPLRQVAKKG